MRGSMTVALVATAGLLLAGCSEEAPPEIPGVSVEGNRGAPPEDVSGQTSSDAATLTAEPSTAAAPSATSGGCAGVFAGGLVEDDIQVRAGEQCELSDVRIEGNILVEDAGVLLASEIYVDGDIQGEGHGDVQVSSSTVTGNIQLEDGGTAVVRDVTIDGDLQAEGNTGLQVFDNNVVGGNLQCQDNEPGPTGTGNLVEGDKEDQCAAL